MRVLICGDIHGNLVALEKMLLKEAGNFDLLVSHGDVVNYGPWSNECLDLLLCLKNVVLLKGNHEENYIKGYYPGTNKVATEFFNFCYPNFNKKALLDTFKATIKIEKFLIQHTIDNLYIFPDSDFDTIMKTKKDNYIIGHSHYQFEYKSLKGLLLYNTGSVGQNRKNINMIEYILYDTDTDKIFLKALPYNITPVINQMKICGYPNVCIEYYEQKRRLN